MGVLKVTKTYYFEEVGIESSIAPSNYSPDGVNLKTVLVAKKNPWGLEELVMNAPFFGAGMDTVTVGLDVRPKYAKNRRINVDAAKIISEYGGIPAFPRSKDLTPKVLIEALKIYKRSSQYCITSPLTIRPDITIEAVLKLSQGTGYTGFPVGEKDGTLAGMLCKRD